MMRIAIAAIIALAAAGCDDVSIADQCLRAERFDACLKSLPAGPQSTRYNDWSEVVSACESAAYYQSLRKKSAIRAECKS